MSVPQQTPIENTLLPAGQTLSTLNFTFTYVDTSTVAVMVNGEVLSTDYYSVVNQQITFNPELVGVSGGSTIVIYLNMEFERDEDILEDSTFDSSDLNNEFDRLTLMAQQLDTDLLRSVTIPLVDTNITTELPVASERANKAFVFDADGNVGVGGDDYVNQVSLCETQATIATEQATIATEQATIAQGWAEASETTVLPDGSITADKINLTEDFTFQSVTATDVTATDVTAENITANSTLQINDGIDGGFSTYVRISGFATDGGVTSKFGNQYASIVLNPDEKPSISYGDGTTNNSGKLVTNNDLSVERYTLPNGGYMTVATMGNNGYVISGAAAVSLIANSISVGLYIDLLSFGLNPLNTSASYGSCTNVLKIGSLAQSAGYSTTSGNNYLFLYAEFNGSVSTTELTELAFSIVVQTA